MRFSRVLAALVAAFAAAMLTVTTLAPATAAPEVERAAGITVKAKLVDGNTKLKVSGTTRHWRRKPVQIQIRQQSGGKWQTQKTVRTTRRGLYSALLAPGERGGIPCGKQWIIRAKKKNRKAFAVVLDRDGNVRVFFCA